MKLSLAKLQLLKCACLSLFMLISFFTGFSQNKIAVKQPVWWVGVAGGANFNSYKGYVSALNVDIRVTPGFEKGHAVGGYYGALLEYHRPDAFWGLMLQQGADDRKGTFTQSGKRLEAKISYFTIEPSLMIMPFRFPLYVYGGPRLGLLWHTRFTYREGSGPEYPQKHINPDAYIKNLDKVTGSIQVGIGYDLMIRSNRISPNVIVSPFITYLPSLDQNLRTIESLRLNTLRAGLILKAGIGSGMK